MIYVYTDGACSGNPGPGGAAFIVISFSGEELYSSSFHFEETTNNRCELSAIIEACEFCKYAYSDDEKIVIRTDSAYCHNCHAQKWYLNWQKNGWLNSKKQPVANKDLWEKLIPYFEKPRFTFEKVKGHTGEADWNDKVDKLAVSRIKI